MSAKTLRLESERVIDQPEVYETGLVDQHYQLQHLETDENSSAVETINVNVKQAYSHFAQRENKVAEFYVQHHGHWKIAPAGADDETDLEKYHRLTSEVNDLVSKIAKKTKSNGPFTEESSLSLTMIASNLEVLSSQLNEMTIAADDSADAQIVTSMGDIVSRFEKFDQTTSSGVDDHSKHSQSTRQLVKLNRIEQRIKSLEDIVGLDEQKMRSLKVLTLGENLTEATESLSSHLQYLKPERFARVHNDLDILIKKLERVEEKFKADPSEKNRAEIDQLCDMVTLTDKYRALVPTLMNRLKFVESTHQKAAEMASTITHLESVQDQISHSVKSNEKELKTLKEVFSTNIEIIKGLSTDISTRISAIN
ncbi:Dynactin subunit 2 [Fragariocoptes setiger]|uniref:Dynactin subunit 2 n=1 Tax=Fragariocoptes setiger TaxID=1670756 RepID=A0ABQ7SAC5_9ACAR|nr:Dynactin subunit 2 [Fragariocoptes setiger]